MTASPIGDAPAGAARAGRVGDAGERRPGARVVPLREFFLAYRKTAARPDEVMIDVRVPRGAPAIQRFYKVSKRILDDISTVAAAFALDLTPDGRVARRAARLRRHRRDADPRHRRSRTPLTGQPWTRGDGRRRCCRSPTASARR